MVKIIIVFVAMWLGLSNSLAIAKDNRAKSSRWNIVFQYAFTDANGRIEIGEIKCNVRRKFCKSPRESELGLNITNLQSNIFDVSIRCCSFSYEAPRRNLIMHEKVLQSNLYTGGYGITRTLKNAFPRYYGKLTLIKR